MASFFQNPFAVDPVVGAQPSTLDQMTTQQILDRMAPIQRQRRRAERLRAGQKVYAESAAKDIQAGQLAQGDYSGGLFPLMHEYIPNYGGMVEKVASGLESYLSGKQAKRAEENLDTMQNPTILGMVQQMSQPDTTQPAASTSTAPVNVEIPPEEAPPEEQPDAQAYNQMSQILGLPQDQADQLGAYNEANVSPNFDLSNKQYDPNAMAQVTMEGMTPQQNQQLTSAKAFMTAAGIPEEDQGSYLGAMAANKSGELPQGQVAGSLDQIPGTAQGAVATAPTESTASVSAPPSLPGSASPEAASAASPDATGSAVPGAVPGGPPQMSAYPTDQTLRAALQMMGVDTKDIIGPRRLVKSFTGADGYVYNQYSDNGTPENTGIKANFNTRVMRDGGTGQLFRVATSAAGGQTREPVLDENGKPVYMTSDQAIAAGVESSKVIAGETAKAEMAPVSARTAAQVSAGAKTGEANVETRQKAAQSLQQMEAFAPDVSRNVTALMNDPALDKVVGSGLWVLADKYSPVDTIAKLWKKGTPEADAAIRITSLKSQVFMRAFDVLRGGGQITEAEGQKATQAMNRMNLAQSPADFRAAMREFVDAYNDALKKLRAAKAGASDIGIPGVPPAIRLPQGGTIE